MSMKPGVTTRPAASTCGPRTRARDRRPPRCVSPRMPTSARLPAAPVPSMTRRALDLEVEHGGRLGGSRGRARTTRPRRAAAPPPRRAARAGAPAAGRTRRARSAARSPAPRRSSTARRTTRRRSSRARSAPARARSGDSSASKRARAAASPRGRPGARAWRATYSTAGTA